MEHTNDAQSSAGNNNSGKYAQASMLQYLFTPPRSTPSDDTISTLKSELDESRKNYSAAWEEIQVLKNEIELLQKEAYGIMLDNRFKYSLIVPLAIFYGHQAAHTMEYDSLSGTYEQVLIPSLVLFHLPVVLTPVMDSLNINIRIHSDLISQGLFLMYLSMYSQNSLSNFGGSFLSMMLLQTLLYLNRQSYLYLWPLVNKLDIKGCLSSANQSLQYLERNLLESVKTAPFKIEITCCICFTVLAYLLNHRQLNKISLYIGAPLFMAIANRIFLTSKDNKHCNMIRSIMVIALAAFPFVVENICDDANLYERYNQDPSRYSPFNLYAVNELPGICYGFLICGAALQMNIYEDPTVDRLTKSLMLVISSCFLGSKLIHSDVSQARAYLHVFGGQHFFPDSQEEPSVENLLGPKENHVIHR